MVRGWGGTLLSRHFAHKIRFPQPEKAYVAGLLHDVGELVNCVSFPEEFRAAAELAMTDKISLYQAEKAMLGFTHCDTGHILAEEWNLPKEVRQVILHHHDVQQATLYPVLVALVSLSDFWCHTGGLGYGSCEEPEFLAEPAWAILTQEYAYLEQVDVPRISGEMEELAAEVRQLVTSLFRN